MDQDKKFLSRFAVLLVMLCSTYIGAITFLPMAPKAEQYANTVLGFILGGVFGVVMKHFYDSSRSSQANQSAIRDIAATLNSPPAPDFTAQPKKDQA